MFSIRGLLQSDRVGTELKKLIVTEMQLASCPHVESLVALQAVRGAEQHARQAIGSPLFFFIGTMFPAWKHSIGKMCRSVGRFV